ncbi:MAG: phosphoribosylaminoimidazolesuccinocarboxamide synthase [Tannerellaceae bacterium]|jgi:phosphoribosylaminoimidazole-succinocarboxamide synthase|nr:phosphoribosylaminoimidazolesuccinocarboxamide synthase [Tannerellaceae bacterium]
MALTRTDFHFHGQREIYRGKVRDVYKIGDDVLVMVATDRISAFDVILPEAIPHKGQVLNTIAADFLDATAGICPNWKLSVPDPMVTIGLQCTGFPVEMVVRGYLCGSAWRAYRQGVRRICGIVLPDGLRENERFPTPVITPTTKADIGQHDQDISREEILERGLVSESDYVEMERYTRLLFAQGTEIAARRGLILVDTKYEFGHRDGRIYLIDEIHTPDSSRYFYLDGYRERFAQGQAPRQLSKEFVREWLIENGFRGEAGQKIPPMTPAIVAGISERYIELFERITGRSFVGEDNGDLHTRIARNVTEALGKLPSVYH